MVEFYQLSHLEGALPSVSYDSLLSLGHTHFLDSL